MTDNPTPVAATPVQYNRSLIYLISIVAAGGGLLFGYDWVVIGGAKPFYEAHFGISDSPLWQGFAMSTALIGCLVGAVVSGLLADRLGRKRLLIFSGALFTFSAVGTALAWDFFSFNTFRLIGGLGIGLASNLSPMYIAEVAPAPIRGRLVSVNQLTIVIGILAAQITNLVIAQPMPDATTVDLIRESWNGTSGWRWMFAAETLPAMGFFLLMFIVPESPRWLMSVGKTDQAFDVWKRIGGTEYATAEQQATMLATPDPTPQETNSVKELTQPGMLKILGLGVFLAVFQQWCGINVIFNYAQEVFSAAGYSVGAMMLNIVITGIVNLVFTVIAMATVDRYGRRGLMLLGSFGLAVIYAVLGTCYYVESRGLHMLILVVSAIACYAMSIAPVTWVIISEIFPNRIRGAAVAVCVFFLWAACTALTFSFPLLNRWLGAHGTFWLYGLVCVVGFIFIYQRLPETKGRTLEEIEQDFQSKT